MHSANAQMVYFPVLDGRHAGVQTDLYETASGGLDTLLDLGIGLPGDLLEQMPHIRQSRPCLTLDCTCGQTLHKISLNKGKEEAGGDKCENGSGHHLTPVD